MLVVHEQHDVQAARAAEPVQPEQIVVVEKQQAPATPVEGETPARQK